MDVEGAADAGLPLLGPVHGERRGRDGGRTSGRRRAGVGRTRSRRVEAALAAFVGRPITVWGTVVGRALRRRRAGVVSLWRGALIGRTLVRTLVGRTVIGGTLRGRTTLVGRTIVWRTLVRWASAVVGFLWWGVVRHGGCGRIRRKLREGDRKIKREREEEEKKGRMKDP